MYTYIESYAKVLGKDGTVRFMYVARVPRTFDLFVLLLPPQFLLH